MESAFVVALTDSKINPKLNFTNKPIENKQNDQGQRYATHSSVSDGYEKNNQDEDNEKDGLQRFPTHSEVTEGLTVYEKSNGKFLSLKNRKKYDNKGRRIRRSNRKPIRRLDTWETKGKIEPFRCN